MNQGYLDHLNHYLDHLIQQAINDYRLTSPKQQTDLANMIYRYSSYLQDVSISQLSNDDSPELQLKRDSAALELTDMYDYAVEQAFNYCADTYLDSYRKQRLLDNKINEIADMSGILREEDPVKEQEVEQPTLSEEESSLEEKIEEIIEEQQQEKEEVKEDDATQVLLQALLESVKELTKRVDDLSIISSQEEKEEVKEDDTSPEAEKEVEETEDLSNTSESEGAPTILDENLEPIQN